MPAASLTDQQKARVKAGKCACGCGLALPRDYTWTNQLYATDPQTGNSDACRARAYRERGKEGRVRKANERRADKLTEEAKSLRARAEGARRAARSLVEDAQNADRRAAELDARAAELLGRGQVRLFSEGVEQSHHAGADAV